MNKGKLININLGKGRFVKMYETDAIAQGLLKARPQAANKMQKPPANKDTVEASPIKEPDEKPPADDFTTITGIGPATARALVSHGITTFEQLKAAEELPYLSAKARAGIDAWRIING